MAGKRFLLGDKTLVRFDLVYVGHFKCNLRRIADYEHLWRYTRDIYNLPGVAGTVNMQHIKGHYYESNRTINPTGIVPAGPVIDYAKVERSHRSDQQEFYRLLSYKGDVDLEAKLSEWENFYNFQSATRRLQRQNTL